MALRSLSLCSGIGGLDLGLERIGAARAVCYVEREAYPAAVLAARMADQALAEAPIWDDLRTFDAGRWRGAVDLVVGGYPCQPFSYAGRREGVQDERHLWPEVLRVYRESGARYLFCENVRGHLSLGFQEVLEDLSSMGCAVEWGVLSASSLGASHRRQRLFFMADSHREGCSTESSSGLFNGERETLWTNNDRRDQDVGHPSGKGLEGRKGLTESNAFPSAWPPGPEDDWSGIPEEFWPATECSLCGMAHGSSTWVDQIRALGHGVVPVVASTAFMVLWRRLHAGR